VNLCRDYGCVVVKFTVHVHGLDDRVKFQHSPSLLPKKIQIFLDVLGSKTEKGKRLPKMKIV